MTRTIPWLLIASLATFGVTLVAGEAEARCLYGSTADCILKECMDCVPTLPEDPQLCASYWYCIPECATPPYGECSCRPECAPP